MSMISSVRSEVSFVDEKKSSENGNIHQIRNPASCTIFVIRDNPADHQAVAVLDDGGTSPLGAYRTLEKLSGPTGHVLVPPLAHLGKYLQIDQSLKS